MANNVRLVTGCGDCPASYFRINEDFYGCELKRGVRHPEERTTPTNCPLKENDITIKLVDNEMR